MFKLTETNQKWWILVAMTSCVSMIFIDITVLPIALPTIQRSLDISQTGLQWIINAYTLALTVFLLAGGRLGDRFGHRKVFIFGLFTFALSSALCGLSQSEAWLVTSRLLQGAGGALLIPNSSAIIFSSFPPNQRGKAMGLYVSIGSIFLAMGPFIGGLLTQYYSWRLVFWINLPIAFIGYGLTLYAVPKFQGSRRKFDFFGFFACVLGISSIVIAIMQTRSSGWNSFWTFSMVIFGAFLIFLLFRFDRRVEDPYIDFSLFRSRTFIGATLCIFCNQFLLMVTVFWAIYFQNVLGFSPAKAGILSLTANLPIMVAAPIAGHLLDKYGPKIPITIGFSIIIVSLSWFVWNTGNHTITTILSAIIPFGCGMPLIFTPSFTTALGQIKKERRGLASGTISMLRQLGSTLGLASIGTLFIYTQGNALSNRLTKNASTENLSVKDFQGLLSKVPAVLERFQALPESIQIYLKKSSISAFLSAFWAINLFAILIASLGLFTAFRMIRPGRISQGDK